MSSKHESIVPRFESFCNRSLVLDVPSDPHTSTSETIAKNAGENIIENTAENIIENTAEDTAENTSTDNLPENHAKRSLSSSSALQRMQRAVRTTIVTNQLVSLSDVTRSLEHLEAPYEDFCDDADSYGEGIELTMEDILRWKEQDQTNEINETNETNETNEELKEGIIEETNEELQNELNEEQKNETSDELKNEFKDENDKNQALLKQSLRSKKSLKSLKSLKSSLGKPSLSPTQFPTSHPRNAPPYTVLAYINSHSGGGVGQSIHAHLSSLLGPSHVVDLHSCRPGNMPEDTLIRYARDPMVRVLACGGDGTMGWMMSSLDKVWNMLLLADNNTQSSNQNHVVHCSPYAHHLPLAIMPLGTGNDLSRQFHWGGTFHEDMRTPLMLRDIRRAKLTTLDRWRCIVVPLQKVSDEEKKWIPRMLCESDDGFDEAIRCKSHDGNNNDNNDDNDNDNDNGDDINNDDNDDSGNVKSDKTNQLLRSKRDTIATLQNLLEDDEQSTTTSKTNLSHDAFHATPPNTNSNSPPASPSSDSSGSSSSSNSSSSSPSNQTSTLASSQFTSPTTQFFDGVFCNYFSLGFDATIAYEFHHERERHPERFTSPFKNKVVYLQKSPKALKCPRLRKRVRILVNDDNAKGDKGGLRELKIPKSCRAIVLMNIQSYAGGHRLTTEGSPTDGLMEVIFASNLVRSATSISLGARLPLLRFKVAAQTNRILIRTKCPLHCQVDGEPWLQGEGIIQIRFHSRNAILEKNTSREGVDCGCFGRGVEDVEEYNENDLKQDDHQEDHQKESDGNEANLREPSTDETELKETNNDEEDLKEPETDKLLTDSNNDDNVSKESEEGQLEEPNDNDDNGNEPNDVSNDPNHQDDDTAAQDTNKIKRVGHSTIRRAVENSVSVQV